MAPVDPLDELIAELDAASADVVRSVKKSRAFIAGRKAPSPPENSEIGERWEPERPDA